MIHHCAVIVLDLCLCVFDEARDAVTAMEQRGLQQVSLSLAEEFHNPMQCSLARYQHPRHHHHHQQE